MIQPLFIITVATAAGKSTVAMAPKRDAKKACTGLDPGWGPGLRERSRALVIFAFMPGLISCTSAAVAPVAEPALASPDVVMAADPQPPFTYWAPENSIIRNHPRPAGVWIAESQDGGRKYYFGDQCRASEFQSFVGRPLDALPKKPADAVWRLTCSTCAALSDLSWTRINVSYEQETETIEEISCG